MKKVLLGSVALLAVAASAPAFAQDYSAAKGRDNQAMMDSTHTTTTRAPMVQHQETQVTHTETHTEPAKADWYEDFTGFYLGGDVGYGITHADVDDAGDVGLNGLDGGGFVGYGFEHSFTPWLGGYMGIEGGWDWSTQDGRIGGTSIDKKHSWSVTLRPGVTINEGVLAYALAGYSMAKYDADGSDDYSGYVVGAGAEFNTMTPLKLRLEYTYSGYEQKNGLQPEDSVVKAGLVFRF